METTTEDERAGVGFVTREQVSAGGVVFRRGGSGIVEVVVVLVGPKGRWQLPKGIVGPGESAEETAVREVREEAGVEAELSSHLRTVEYWYVGSSGGARVRFHKFVHFYLLRYLQGDVAEHDHEVLEARWVTMKEAVRMLAFRNEREVVELARESLEERGED